MLLKKILIRKAYIVINKITNFDSDVEVDYCIGKYFILYIFV